MISKRNNTEEVCNAVRHPSEQTQSSFELQAIFADISRTSLVAFGILELGRDGPCRPRKVAPAFRGEFTMQWNLGRGHIAVIGRVDG